MVSALFGPVFPRVKRRIVLSRDVMAAKLNQSDDKLNTVDLPGLKTLKILVIVMGILIIAGVTVVVVTIANRMSAKSDKRSAGAHTLGKIEVGLPPGSRVISVSSDQGRLNVHLEDGSGRASVLVLDAVTGRPIGTIDFGIGR